MSYIDLSTRNTKSNSIPHLDLLYAYQTRHKVKFTHRHQLGDNYRYLNHGAVEQAGRDEIHIYHRSAEIRGVTQGLTMITKQKKVREVQRWFNEQIKLIEEDDNLFDVFSHAGATPVGLKLFYTYTD